MKKIKKICLALLFSFVMACGILLFNPFVAKAHDSADSTNSSYWDKTTEEIKERYGLYYSHMEGASTTKGILGSEKNVNYFSMKTDGVSSKLVTWIRQSGNSNFATTQLSDLARDYEEKHPGWIVLAGINADQWYYETNSSSQKGGYFYYKNQTYYPFTMDGQNLFTINPMGGSSNGVAITNNPQNPFINITGSSSIEIQIYDDNDALIGCFSVDGYNQSPDNNQTMVWSGHKSAIEPATFESKDVSSEHNLYIVENADLAYMNNSRDYQEGNKQYHPVDSFYGKGVISKIANSITLTQGQFAIETTNPELLAMLTEGTKVIVEQQYDQLEANAVESVTGYHTVQVRNGVQQSSSSDYNTGTRPRSIFGVNEDGSYFLMTVRDKSSSSKGGTVHTETNALLNYYHAYNAWQDDGGGSVTAIYRNATDGFDVVSSTVDSATPGAQRAVASGLFFVVRDPGLVSRKVNSTPTTIRLNKKQLPFVNELTDIKVTVDDKTYDFEGDSLTIPDLKDDSEYVIKVNYIYKGEEYEAMLYGETTPYDSGLKFIRQTRGFMVTREKTDEVLKTIGATIKITDHVYNMPDTDRFEIDDLIKDKEYKINYTYTVQNTNTQETYEKEGPEITTSTLSYELPKITKFEGQERQKSRVSITYTYEDLDGIVTEAYILKDGEKQILAKRTGTETFNDLDLENNEYHFQLVIKYEVEGELEEQKSEELVFGTAPCEHDFEDATCEKPKTCKKCGATEGKPLGHDFMDATTDAPKTCRRCGKTEGEPLSKTDSKKGCSCKKSGVYVIITSLVILGASLILLRKKR